MKINNTEKFQQHQMEHLYKQPMLMVQAAKVIMITVEMWLQLQEMGDRDQQTQAKLLRIGVEISPPRRQLSLLPKMETPMPIEPSAIM